MSNKLLTAVGDNSKTTGSARLILLALADRANKKGECWPGIKCIAKFANVSERTVKDYLKVFTKIGLIRIDPRRAENGRQTSNSYHILIDKIGHDLITQKMLDSVRPKSRRSSGRGATGVSPEGGGHMRTPERRSRENPGEGVTGVPPHVLNPHKESSEREEPGAARPAAGAASSFSSFDFGNQGIGAPGSSGFAANPEEIKSSVQIDHPGSSGSAASPASDRSYGDNNRPESKKPLFKKSNSPVKQSMTPDETTVLESWKRNYEITHHRSYLDNPEDLPAIRELLTAANPRFIEDQFTTAFLLHGDPRVWTCTNRMVDLKTTVKNWNKITAEVAEHLTHEHMQNFNRAQIGEDRLYWKTAHRLAVKTLEEVLGPEWATSRDLVFMLCLGVAIKQISPYFRCVLPPNPEEVKKKYWPAAVEEYEQNSTGGIPVYLVEHDWEIPQQLPE
jgi:hypothetical protein